MAAVMANGVTWQTREPYVPSKCVGTSPPDRLLARPGSAPPSRVLIVLNIRLAGSVEPRATWQGSRDGHRRSVLCGQCHGTTVWPGLLRVVLNSERVVDPDLGVGTGVAFGYLLHADGLRRRLDRSGVGRA